MKLSHLHLRDHFSPPFLSACESKEINPVISRERLQSNFNQKFQISFCEMQIVPIESTAKEVSFEWSHCRVSSTDSKVDSITWSGKERVKWSSGPQEKASKPYSLIFNAFLREDNTLAPTSLLKL